MAKEVFRIKGTSDFLVEGRVVKAIELSEVELQELNAQCQGTREPIFGGDQDKEIVVVEEQVEIPMDHTFGPYENAPEETSPKSNHENDQVVTLGGTEYTEDYLDLQERFHSSLIKDDSSTS